MVYLKNVTFLLVVTAQWFGSLRHVSCESVNPHFDIKEPTQEDFDRASKDPVNIDLDVSPALTENEQYRDILHFTSSNFTDIVLKSKDPWILIFHDGSILKTWKTMSATLRGVMWFGLVHQKEEPKILKLLVRFMTVSI